MVDQKNDPDEQNTQTLDEFKPLATKVTATGIRIALGAEGDAWDEWIEFKRQWMWGDRVRWDEALDVGRMKLIIEWANEWRVKDADGALIPLEKEKLLAHIAALKIPYQKTRLFARAMYAAFAEAYSLPLA